MKFDNTKPFCYHATSGKAWAAMLKDGCMDGQEGDYVWNVSEGANYFYHAEELSKAMSREEDDMDLKNDSAAREAFSNGSLTAARDNDDRVVVIEIRLEDDEWAEDTSCDNVGSSTGGAVVKFGKIPVERINRIFVIDGLAPFRFFSLASMMKHELFEMPYMSNSERAVISRLKDFDQFEVFDALGELPWKAEELSKEHPEE